MPNYQGFIIIRIIRLIRRLQSYADKITPAHLFDCRLESQCNFYIFDYYDYGDGDYYYDDVC